MTLPSYQADTICAIATPDGPGALAIVRISGPKGNGISGCHFYQRFKINAGQ